MIRWWSGRRDSCWDGFGNFRRWKQVDFHIDPHQRRPYVPPPPGGVKRIPRVLFSSRFTVPHACPRVTCVLCQRRPYMCPPPEMGVTWVLDTLLLFQPYSFPLRIVIRAACPFNWIFPDIFPDSFQRCLIADNVFIVISLPEWSSSGFQVSVDPSC
jgi:hypothetical protein